MLFFCAHTSFAQGLLTAISNGGTRLAIARSCDNSVDVFDIGSESSITSIAVGNLPTGVVFSVDDAQIYVSNTGDNTVTVIDADIGGDVYTVNMPPIGVGSQPCGLDITPDGAYLYVSNSGSDDVSVVRLSDQVVLNPIAVGNAPTSILIFNLPFDIPTLSQWGLLIFALMALVFGVLVMRGRRVAMTGE